MTDVFMPTRDKDTLALLGRARKRIAGLRETEARNGFLSDEDGPLDNLLRTAIIAIASGVERKDWGTVAEGLVMVQSAEVRARPSLHGRRPST